MLDRWIPQVRFQLIGGDSVLASQRQSSGPEETAGSVYNAAHKAAMKQPGPITDV